MPAFARKLIRAAWFVAICIVLAVMLVQLPSSPGNQGLMFVVMWAMLTPLLRVAEGEHKWTHLGRGLLGGIGVWILSAVKDRTLGQQPHTMMALFSVGVLLFALIGWYVESRQEHRGRT
jgi:hypothetical protein